MGSVLSTARAPLANWFEINLLKYFNYGAARNRDGVRAAGRCVTPAMREPYPTDAYVLPQTCAKATPGMRGALPLVCVHNLGCPQGYPQVVPDWMGRPRARRCDATLQHETRVWTQVRPCLQPKGRTPKVCAKDARKVRASLNGYYPRYACPSGLSRVPETAPARTKRLRSSAGAACSASFSVQQHSH